MLMQEGRPIFQMGNLQLREVKELPNITQLVSGDTGTCTPLNVLEVLALAGVGVNGGV